MALDLTVEVFKFNMCEMVLPSAKKDHIMSTCSKGM